MKLLIIALIVIALAAVIIVDTILTRQRIATGVALAERAKAFSRERADATLNIAMIGDSTVVGVGATAPEDSLAGLVSASFPAASITNLGVNGAKTKELIPRLEAIPSGEFDLIMVHIGGNDIVRLTNVDELAQSIASVLKLAAAKAKHVTLVTSGNVGTAPLLPWGLRWVFEQRTRTVRKIFIAAAAQANVRYIDLFREHAQDPYYGNPEYYYAADLFHPSTTGYADWYSIIGPALEQIKFEKK